MLTCESALMAKVCEMIVNRDYIRENNAGHPPRASHRTYVSSARAGIYAPRARTWVIRVCMRVHARTCVRVCVCVYAGAMLSRTCVEKSGRAGGRARAGGRRYFFTRNERVQGETCIRLAGGVVGAAAGDHGTRMRGEGDSGARRRWRRVARVVHPLPSIFRGFFLRATALACLDERTRGGTSIIYNQTADKATIALL